MIPSNNPRGMPLLNVLVLLATILLLFIKVPFGSQFEPQFKPLFTNFFFHINLNICLESNGLKNYGVFLFSLLV